MVQIEVVEVKEVESLESEEVEVDSVEGRDEGQREAKGEVEDQNSLGRCNKRSARNGRRTPFFFSRSKHTERRGSTSRDEGERWKLRVCSLESFFFC